MSISRFVLKLMVTAASLAVLAASPASATVPQFTVTNPADGTVVNALPVPPLMPVVAFNGAFGWQSPPPDCDYRDGGLAVGYLGCSNLGLERPGPDGAYTLWIQGNVVDGVTPIGMVTDSVGFVLDTADPVAAITPLAGDITSLRRPVFSFGATDANPVTFRCNLDGSGLVPCASPWTVLADLADGSHSLVVLADDGANQAYAPAYGFVVDTVPPTITLIDPTAGAVYADPTPVVNLAVDGGTASCSYDDKPWAACDALFVVNPLPNGPHRLCVRAVDTAGNAALQCVDFVVDAGDNIFEGPRPASAKLKAARGGRVARGRFKTKFSVRVTPATGVNMETACWGKVTFSVRPKARGAKHKRTRAALKRSGDTCVATATIALASKNKHRPATAKVVYSGSTGIGGFTRSIRIKRL